MKISKVLLFAMTLTMCFAMNVSAGNKVLKYNEQTIDFFSGNVRSCVQNTDLVPQYCGQVILMEIGRKHNISTLVAATGKSRLIYPEGCATVTADGEEVFVASVEAYADGSLYIFTDDLLDEDMDVKVTFTNPIDTAYRIVYTDGDLGALPDYNGPAYPNENVEVNDALGHYYRLIYMLDGVEYAVDWVGCGTELVPKEVVKEGYIFSGWSGLPEFMPHHDVIVTGTFSADGIDTIVTNQFVDVYDLQGVMVKRQISVKNLKNELGKGLYIINGKMTIIW